MTEEESKGKESVVVTEDVFMKGIERIESIAKSIAETNNSVTESENDDFVKSAIEDSDEIRNGVEVSPFLNDLVETIGEAMNNVRKSFVSSHETLTKAIAESTEVMKSMVEAIKGLEERVRSLENAPAAGGRKSVLEKGIERFPGEGTPKLSKSKILEILIKKAQSGEDDVTSLDVTRFETFGVLRKSLAEKILSKEVE